MPTAEQAREIEKRNRAGNPVLWLKTVFDKAEMPELVRAHINQLFKQHTVYKGVDPDTSYPIALQIIAKANLMRSQYALTMLDPLDKRYFPTSKTVSQWATNIAKFNKTQPVGRSPESSGSAFPSTAENPDDSEPDSSASD